MPADAWVNVCISISFESSAEALEMFLADAIHGIFDNSTSISKRTFQTFLSTSAAFFFHGLYHGDQKQRFIDGELDLLVAL